MTDTRPCPSCGSAIAIDATQCRACKRVFGEDNRCPHCDAFAVARWNGVELSCSACGKPRERKPKTVVIEEKGGSGETITAQAGSLALQGAGVVGFGLAGLTWLGGVLAVTAGDSLSAALVAAAVGTGFGALGFMAFRRGKRSAEKVGVRDRAAAEIRVLALAEQKGGVLRVTDVVRGLGLPSAEAEALLTSLVDSTRVTLELDSEGLLSYHFRELQNSARLAPAVSPPKVRVDTTTPESAEEVDARIASKDRENQA